MLGEGGGEGGWVDTLSINARVRGGGVVSCDKSFGS